MKLFTPQEKENQRKVLAEIRNGNLKFCRYYIEILAGEEVEHAGVENYDRHCFQGAMQKVLGGDRPEAWESVGYALGKDRSSIVAFNDRKANSLNDVADYLVREHGWQDIK